VNVTGTVTADGLTVANTAVIAGDFDGGTAATYIRLQDDTDNFLFGSNNSLGNFLIKNETADAFRLSVANTGDISFYEDTGTTPKFFWDASAESLGIGTSSPTSALQVGDGTDTTNWLRLTGTVSDLYIGQNTALAHFGQTNAAKLLSIASYPLAMGTANAYPVIFGTNDIERMRIDGATGNVDIGGNGTGSGLGVYLNKGAVANFYEASDGTKTMITGTDAGNDYVKIGSLSAHPVGFVVGNGEKMRIDSAGNVGIGVVPDTWSLASHGVIDLGLYGSVNSSSTLGTTLSFNAYYNSGWKAKNTTGAMLYLQDSASHQWFTSSSVNADATITDFSGPKMKLDASGNLLVGKTATAFGTAGVEASASSGLWSTRSGFPALALNRLSTEGSVADFYKDGTIVGSIGSKQNDTGTGNSYIYIAGGNTGLFFDDVNNYIRPANTSGGLRDNIVDLGEPDSRFKDLFIGNDIGHLDAADNARLLYDKSANLLGNAGTNGTFATLSKSSGSFKIDHPLPEKTETHYLVHSFVESPQANNIYRGKVDLVDGLAAVNIDDAAGMTEGTYVLLNTNTQCFTSNESGWTAVKGSVSGNILTITAQDNTCTDTISWMVIGERHDQHMLDTEWTDENGKVIVEPLKESQGDAP